MLAIYLQTLVHPLAVWKPLYYFAQSVAHSVPCVWPATQCMYRSFFRYLSVWPSSQQVTADNLDSEWNGSRLCCISKLLSQRSALRLCLCFQLPSKQLRAGKHLKTRALSGISGNALQHSWVFKGLTVTFDLIVCIETMHWPSFIVSCCDCRDNTSNVCAILCVPTCMRLTHLQTVIATAILCKKIPVMHFPSSPHCSAQFPYASHWMLRAILLKHYICLI